MSELPNVVLPSDLTAGSHNALSSYSSIDSSRPRPGSSRAEGSSSVSNVAYTSGMRHTHSPYRIPRRLNPISEQPSNLDPPSSSLVASLQSFHQPRSERPIFHEPTTSSSPPLRSSDILVGVDEPSSNPSFGYGNPAEQGPPDFHPSWSLSSTPRIYLPPSLLFTDPFELHNPHHSHSVHNLSAQFSDSQNVFSSRGLEDPTEAELKTLQRRVRELEADVVNTKSQRLLGIPPVDSEARLRFREQKFCSLNRAGNALCAWHDSRRERRRFPPRMAPHRTLNCGCTYDEALFEESLSRNGVGSFWPGESVRMDPLLRNNLLSLLQKVYGYADGDFERNLDGTWKEGQDVAAWEERARRPVRRERS